MKRSRVNRTVSLVILCALLFAALPTSLAFAQFDSFHETPPETPPEEPAEERGDDLGTFAIHWENDGTILKRNHARDRHYTNGLAITFAHQPQWARSLAPHMPFAEQFGEAQTAAGYIVGQEIYTPEDIENPNFIPDDRPFAGYLYAGVYWQRAGYAAWADDVRTMDHFQFDIGTTGQASMADEAQMGIHDFFELDDAAGWKHQISDEPTAQLSVRKFWRLDVGQIPLGDRAADPRIDLQVITHIGGRVGTIQGMLEGGVMLRFGGNLPDDFGPGKIRVPRAAYGRKHHGVSFYGFVSAEGALVGYDALLEGSLFDSSDPGVDARPWIGQISVGVGLEARPTEHWQLGVMYWQTFTNETFEGQSGGDGYGAMTLHATYTY